MASLQFRPQPDGADGDWLALAGNIPSLYDLCRRAIREHDILRDAVALDDTILPEHLALDIIEDGDGGGAPVACRESAPGDDGGSCGCAPFFNPGSAVFLDETTAVVLEGRCCLKKAVVRIERGGTDVRWPPIERTPRAAVAGGGASGRRFVLRTDGAVIGVVRDTLCVFPHGCEGGERAIQRRLHFDAAGRYYDIVLPSVIRSRDTVFAVGMYRVRRGMLPSCDVLAIDVRTGVVRRASDGAKVAETASGGDGTRGEGEYPCRLPHNFEPTNLVEIPGQELVLVGSVPDGACDARGALPVVCKCHVKRRDNRPQEWVMGLLCVRVFRGPSERIIHPQTSSSSVAYSDRCGACMVVYVRDGTADAERCGHVFSSSTDGGRTWSGMRPFRQTLTNWGVTNDPPILAFAPSGRLYAFAYEARDCRIAEQRSLLRQSKRRDSWPSMKVYRWSNGLCDAVGS